MPFFKTALIGLGRMGAEPSSRFEGQVPDGWLPISHAEAIQTTKGMKLVALCEPDENRLLRFKEYYGVNDVYSDYRDLIDGISPDIISIATRTDVRCEIINYALSKGVRGIYAEKPFSRSIKDCKQVLEHIQMRDAKIVYGATRRAMDVYKKAKEIVWSGELGNINEISIEFGKSSLFWSLPHATDLIVYFANTTEIDSIQGFCDIESGSLAPGKIDFDPVIESASFTFTNGIHAVINQTSGFNVRIGCSKGNLTVHGNGHFIEMNRGETMTDYFHSMEKITVDSKMSGTQYLMQDLEQAVRNKTDIQHIRPEEILCGMQLLFGIICSTLKNGSRIKVSDIDEELVVTGRTGSYFA